MGKGINYFFNDVSVPRLITSNTITSNGIISAPQFHVLDGGSIASVITSSVATGHAQDSVSHGFRNLNGTVTYATISATGLFVNGAAQVPKSSTLGYYFGDLNNNITTSDSPSWNTGFDNVMTFSSYDGNYHWRTGATGVERMRLNSAGLTVNGEITGNEINISGPTATARFLRFQTSGVDVSYIALGGDNVSQFYSVPIGGGHNFQIDGTVRLLVSGTGAAITGALTTTGNININRPTGENSLVNFSADGGTKTGLVGIDSTGNMVIRNNSAGAAYVDSYDGNVFFRNVSNGYANCGVLSQTSFAHPGNIYANAEFRLNNGATFSRVAKLDSSGGWGGGYNFLWNTNSTATHDSTGTIAGIAFNTNGSVRIYAGASANAATVATQMVTIDSAQSNFQKTVSITGVAGGQNSTLSLYNPVGVSYSIIDWWSEGAQVGQLISAPGSILYHSFDTHVFRNLAATNQYLQINSTGLFGNGSITAVGTATFNGATAHAQLNSRGNTAIYSTNAANTTVTLGAQVFLGDSNFNNGSFYNSAPGIGSVYDSNSNNGGGLGVFIYNGVAAARSKVAEFTIAGVTIGTPALPSTITLTNTGITTFPEGQVRIGATSFIGSIPKLGVKMATADWAAQFEGHTTVGQSYGLSVVAGTNAGDYCALFRNTSASELFSIKGDGTVNSIGNITAPRHISTAQEGFRLADNTGPYLSFFNLAQTTRYGYIQHATTTLTIANEVATTGHINFSTNGGNVLVNNNTVWHAGNDGAGSGLDADLIDGYNSTQLFIDNRTSFAFRGGGSVGYLQFSQGLDTRTGYIEFYNSVGTRQGYIGYAATGQPILFNSDSGGGFQFDGGVATFNNSIKTTSPTGGVGYAAGAGGTVTQLTDKSTGVTLNKICGQITLHNETIGPGVSRTFTLNNSTIAATDVIILNLASGNTIQQYKLWIDGVAAGSCKISIKSDAGGSIGEAVVINFAVIKSMSA